MFHNLNLRSQSIIKVPEASSHLQFYCQCCGRNPAVDRLKKTKSNKKKKTWRQGNFVIQREMKPDWLVKLVSELPKWMIRNKKRNRVSEYWWEFGWIHRLEPSGTRPTKTPPRLRWRSWGSAGEMGTTATAQILPQTRKGNLYKSSLRRVKGRQEGRSLLWSTWSYSEQHKSVKTYRRFLIPTEPLQRGRYAVHHDLDVRLCSCKDVMSGTYSGLKTVPLLRNHKKKKKKKPNLYFSSNFWPLH